MSKVVIAVLAVAVIGGVSFIRADTAKCAWCPSYQCYSRCSTDCACVTVGGGGGSCVSIQAIPNDATVLE